MSDLFTLYDLAEMAIREYNVPEDMQQQLIRSVSKEDIFRNLNTNGIYPEQIGARYQLTYQTSNHICSNFYGHD